MTKAILAMLMAASLAACTPSPEMNVLGYLVSEHLGTLRPADLDGPAGALTGVVLDGESSIAGASVLVAERTGRPHVAQTDAEGRYRIEDIPVGQYVPAAIAPGYDEAAASDGWGIPSLVTVYEGVTTEAPPLVLSHRTAPTLPANLADTAKLMLTDAYTATAVFPEGAAAQVRAYQFERDGVVVDTLRVYLPADLGPDEEVPLLFFSYPGDVDGWEPVSVGYASEGYGLVALSPAAAWGVDIDEHAYDARVALALAREGALGPHFADEPAVALGGSFSSAILNRLLRDAGDEIGAWVTVGGIGDAFAGAHDFYTDAIELPPAYELIIPALGNPQIYPLPLLRFSPVYVAGQLPPTLIIHTAADRIIPLQQAVDLAAATEAAGVPVETFYYDDVSHYLQIDENMTDEARAMYYHILDFIEKYGRQGSP